jgi:hypothetical protein
VLLAGIFFGFEILIFGGVFALVLELLKHFQLTKDKISKFEKLIENAFALISEFIIVLLYFITFPLLLITRKTLGEVLMSDPNEEIKLSSINLGEM